MKAMEQTWKNISHKRTIIHWEFHVVKENKFKTHEKRQIKVVSFV